MVSHGVKDVGVVDIIGGDYTLECNKTVGGIFKVRFDICVLVHESNEVLTFIFRTCKEESI